MSKSVMVMDTPANCKECRISKCEAWVDDDARPDGCILRPLPDKVPCNYYEFEGFTAGHDRGWNDYADHITGDWNKYKPEVYQ